MSSFSFRFLSKNTLNHPKTYYEFLCRNDGRLSLDDERGSLDGGRDSGRGQFEVLPDVVGFGGGTVPRVGVGPGHRVHRVAMRWGVVRQDPLDAVRPLHVTRLHSNKIKYFIVHIRTFSTFIFKTEIG